MNAASVRTERKISRFRSSSDLIWTLYRRAISTASSSASIESRPSPSANSGLSTSISCGWISFSMSVCTIMLFRSFSMSLMI
jgi:hypothetical protein